MKIKQPIVKRVKFLSVFFVFSLFLTGCDNASDYNELAEAEDRCVFRVPLNENDKNYELRFNYIQAFLMKKTFDAQDYEHKHIPKSEKNSSYVEFDMHKSCQEIVEMIFDQL